jgi:hypothetical protein
LIVASSSFTSCTFAPAITTPSGPPERSTIRLFFVPGLARARGRSVRHYGGRLLWQLEDCQALLVAWKVEPYSTAPEYDLLEEFIVAHGKLPFANLKRGLRNAPRLRGA